MNLTLRQAHKVVEKIAARMATIELSPTVTIGIWSDPAGEFEKQVRQFQSNLIRQLALTDVRQIVRNQIRTVNQVEVDGLISQRKALVDQISIIRTIAAVYRPDSLSSGVAVDKKAKAATAASEAGAASYGSDSITACVLTVAQFDTMSKQIDTDQLQIESIEDQLTAANASRVNMVTLSDSTVAMLRSEGIVS